MYNIKSLLSRIVVRNKTEESAEEFPPQPALGKVKNADGSEETVVSTVKHDSDALYTLW